MTINKPISIYSIRDAKLTMPNIQEPLMNYCINKDKTPYRIVSTLIASDAINTKNQVSWINEMLDKNINRYKRSFRKYRQSTHIVKIEGGYFCGFLLTSPKWASVSRVYFVNTTCQYGVIKDDNQLTLNIPSSYNLTRLWHDLYDFYAELWNKNIKVTTFNQTPIEEFDYSSIGKK